MAPSENAANQDRVLQFHAPAYGMLIFQPIPKAPEGTDPKVAEWWNKSQPFNGVAKRLAEQSKILVNAIDKLINKGTSRTHPTVVRYVTELEQVEKERAELKKQFLAWLREGQENSYSVPLPDGGQGFLLRAGARYTDLARMKGITGIITLNMTVYDNGIVAALTVAKSLPDGQVENAIYAANLNIFLPSTKGGKFITFRGKIEYSFNLSDIR
jgi:TonB family protein